MSLFAELQRRNVFRVAIAYGVIAWVLAQISDLAFDNFGSPEWVSKTVLFLLVLGMLEIRRLRNLAEKQLSADFDLREYHDRMLENGSMTLPMVEKTILAWIDRVQSGE